MTPLAENGSKPTLVMKLYVVGESPISLRAQANLRRICESNIGPYELEIVDLLDDPLRALRDGVTVTPTFMKISPPPVRKLIGDLDDEPRVRLLLGLAD